MQRNWNYFYLIVLAIVFSCCDANNKQTQRNISIVESYYTHVNSGDTTNLNMIVSDNFIKINNENIASATGIELFKSSIISHMKNNSEYEFIIDDLFCENNKVAVRWTWKSTNIKTGIEKPVISKGISIFKIENDRIVKIWQAFDMLSFTNQLK